MDISTAFLSVMIDFGKFVFDNVLYIFNFGLFKKKNVGRYIKLDEI